MANLPTGGTVRSHVADPRKHLKREEVISALLAALLLLVSVWALVTGFLLQRQAADIEAAYAAQAIVEDFEDRSMEALDAWDAIAQERARAGLLPRLQAHQEIASLTERAIELTKGWQRGALVQVQAMTDTTITLMHECVLLRLDARAAASIGDSTAVRRLEARATAVESEADRAAARGQRAAARLRSSYALPLHEVVHGLIAILALTVVLLALAALLFWRHHSLRRELDRSLTAAFLVEEMLESYGLELEQVNRELERANLWKLQVLTETTRVLEPDLATIRGALTGLNESVELPEGRAGAITAATEAITRAEREARRLREVSLSEDSGVVLAAHPIEITSLVDRVITRFRPRLEGKGLALLVVPPAEGWPRVVADPDRLGEVLNGLMRNALDATTEGSLRVTGRIVLEPRPSLRIEIADTGRGIASHELHALFRPGGEPNSEASGRNLGLGLSRLLMQAMGGSLGLESEGVGHGARAWVQIPLASSIGKSGSGGASARRAA